eukprot:gene4826-9622_t
MDNNYINGNSAWLGAVQRNDDATVAAVEIILIEFRRNIHTSNSTTTSTITRVAMKFMSHREQFYRETEARAAINFDEKYVLPLLRVFDGDSSTKENIDLYGLTEYPYCIVMEAATQDLKRFIDHEQIIDMNIEEIKPIMRQLTCCLDHIHKKNFVHGDVKPLNILQKGALLTLTDLDVSCSIGNDVFAGIKSSSGYLPSEMFWCDPQSGDEVKVRTPIQSSNVIVIPICDTRFYPLENSDPAGSTFANRNN